jgi:hypothetical protein
MRLISIVAILFLSTSLLAQNPKKSTPEERQQWAEALHKLEANPDDAQAQQTARHALDRLIEVDDVTITPCAFKELPDNYKPFKPISSTPSPSPPIRWRPARTIPWGLTSTQSAAR